MSYYYSDWEIEEMIDAGIISNPNDHSLDGKNVGVIERNTKCPKCNGPVKVIAWNQDDGIECQKCGHKFS